MVRNVLRIAFLLFSMYLLYVYNMVNSIKFKVAYKNRYKVVNSAKKQLKPCVVTECNFPKDDNHPGYLLPNNYSLCNGSNTNISMEEYVYKQKIHFKKSNIPIIFINMEKSKLRRQTVQKSLKRFFNTVIRFEALTVENEQVKEYTKKFSNVNSKVIAVTLSHYNAIKYASEKLDSKYVIIAEDDVSTSFHPFWTQSLDSFLDTFPSDTEAIQLFASMITLGLEPIYFNKNTKHRSKNNEYGAVAYVLTRKGMNIITKIDLNDLHSRCNHFTADDCLLSFTPYKQWSGNTFQKSFTIHPSMFSLHHHPSTFDDKKRDILNKNI